MDKIILTHLKKVHKLALKYQKLSSHVEYIDKDKYNYYQKFVTYYLEMQNELITELLEDI